MRCGFRHAVVGRVTLMTLGTLLLLPACKDDSFALVSVLTRSGSVSNVAQFRVVVDNGTAESVLLYPKTPSQDITVDDQRAVTFSIEFDSSRTGTTTVKVEAMNRAGVSLGEGAATAELTKEGVVKVPVVITLKGVLCNPYEPTAACGATRTCGLLCAQGAPAASMCYAAGSGKAGTACTDNTACAPGSQCFDFAASGCAVKTCLRFCNNDDAACGETGAYCNVPITCGTPPPFMACSRPCDPTGNGRTGCAAGLVCYVYANETTDCACPGVGALGSSCVQNSDCAAGTSCVVPVQSGAGASNGACRPICNLATPICPSGTTCHPFVQSKQNQYGYCQ